nr:MAG: replication-associated protein [Canine stool-associated circular virus]
MPLLNDSHARAKPHRSYCVTLNNPTPRDLEAPQDFSSLFEAIPDIRYAIWQLERGTEGTLHIQAYLELVRPQRFSFFGTTSLKGAHFEARKGSRDQAREYCRKEDSRINGPWETGSYETGGQGNRSDLTGVVEAIKRRAPLFDIVQDSPEVFIKYHRGIKEAINVLNPPVPRDPTQEVEVHFYYGPSGCGKTRAITADAGTMGVYWKDNGKWWDGYQDHITVICDDFSGRSMAYSDFKRWFDRYPCRVEFKGGSTELVARRFYISAISLPDLWWDRDVVKTFNWTEVARRITHVHAWDSNSKEFILFQHTESTHALDQLLLRNDLRRDL